MGRRFRSVRALVVEVRRFGELVVSDARHSVDAQLHGGRNRCPDLVRIGPDQHVVLAVLNYVDHREIGTDNGSSRVHHLRIA